MNRIGGVAGARVTAGRGVRAGAGKAGGFSVAGSECAAPEEVQGSRAAGVVGLTGILALQEVETDTARDKTARRHGVAMLDALAALQALMLGGAPGRTEVAALSRLVDGTPAAADAGLGDVVAAIRLRAKIELLRCGREAGQV